MGFSQWDFKALSDLGQALWADGRHSEMAALESIEVISLLELPEDRFIERVCSSLLHRARKEGVAAAASRIHEAFFRLPPEERLALALLHCDRGGAWSYARVARVLGTDQSQAPFTTEAVEELVWAVRLHLALSTTQGGKGASARFRSAPGSPRLSPDCPEHHPARPWTQRFLDKQLGTRQELYLRTHASRCAGCRQALVHARHVYYAVDAIVPRAETADDEARERRLKEAVVGLRIRGELAFGDTLRIFARRTEVQWALAALGVLVLWKIFS